MKLKTEFDVYKDRFTITPLIGISWDKYDYGFYFIWLVFSLRIGNP